MSAPIPAYNLRWYYLWLKKTPSVLKALLLRYKQDVLLNRISTVLIIDILVKLSSVALLPVYLRLMTQAEFGMYAYLISIILTFALILNFGLYIPLSKYYHDRTSQQQRGSLLYTLSILLLSFLAVVMVPVYAFELDYKVVKILFKNPINYTAYRTEILTAIIVASLNFMLTSYFFTSERIDKLKRYNIWRIILTHSIAISFLYFSKDSDSPRLRLAATYAVELVIFLFFLSYFLRDLYRKFDKRTAKAALKLGLPVMASAIFGIVINFADKFFLEKYSSFADLSYYYLAVSCTSVIPLIVTSMQNAWLPLFLKERDLVKNIQRTDKLMFKMFLSLLIVSVLIIVLLKVILELGIIPIKYYQTIYILPILLFSQIVSALVTMYGNYFVYFERTDMGFLSELVICVISIVLSLVLIPKYKVFAAAVVNLVTNAFYLLLYYFIIRSYIKKRLMSGVVK